MTTVVEPRSVLPNPGCHLKENGRGGGHFPMLALLLLPPLGACVPAGPRPATGLVVHDDVPMVLLGVHNRERAAVKVRPLSWSPALAAAAESYARQLAAIGRLRHSPRASRSGQGENLWMGTRGAFPVEQMAGSWASERAYFRRGIFPAVSRTGNWSAVGHYTQMIWPTTTHLGCATASSARYEVLVCRYAPAGNIDGRRLP